MNEGLLFGRRERMGGRGGDFGRDCEMWLSIKWVDIDGMHGTDKDWGWWYRDGEKMIKPLKLQPARRKRVSSKGMDQ